MMEEFFLKLLNIGLISSWLVLTVILLRALLKKHAPRWTLCLLWGLVAIRLLLPVPIESDFSLLPSSDPIPADITTAELPEIHTGVSVANSVINPILTTYFAPAPEASVNPMQLVTLVATVVWLVGTAAMLLYSFFSYLRLRRRICACITLERGVLLCDHVETPFILGIIRPRICLPSSLPEESRQYVLAHERAHIRRGDHIWKPLGFLLLSVYWFNPLLWVAYIMLCRDIESACDERVLRRMGSDYKKPYAEVLLSCSIPRRYITACPLAFGEVGVKERVRSVLSYKKPAFWIILVALVATVAVGVCFLTVPASIPLSEIDESAFDHFFDNATSTDLTAYVDGTPLENQMQFPSVESGFRRFLIKLPIEKRPLSHERRDKTDASYYFRYADAHTIYFNRDCSEVWLSTAGRTSYPYRVKQPEETKEMIENFLRASEDVQARIRVQAPDYFGLDTSEGLTVYGAYFSAGSPRCVLASNKAGEPDYIEMSFWPALSVEEMKYVLSTYDLPKEKISYKIYQNYLSSYLPFSYMTPGESQSDLLRLIFEENIIPEDVRGGEIRDAVPYDINGDGVKEYLFLSVMSTGSAIFTFDITCCDSERNTLYKNQFTSGTSVSPHFGFAEDGSVKVTGYGMVVDIDVITDMHRYSYTVGLDEYGITLTPDSPGMPEITRTVDQRD